MSRVSYRARDIADRCRDAYSADRYGSWPAVAQRLLDMGYDDREVEAVMRSKYTRWAADQSDRPYGSVPAHAISDMRARWPQMFSKEEIDNLVAGTFE